MLTRLRIDNFKAWKDTGEIRLAPITVLFGINSSGKTSILQSLVMLRQTYESPDRRRVLHPGDDNTDVDLGTVQDLIFGHQETAELGFELEWHVQEPLTLIDPKTDLKYTGQNIQFLAKIGQQNGRVPRLIVKKMEYRLDSQPVPVTIGMTRQEGDADKYDLTFDGVTLVRHKQRAWPLPAPLRFYGFPDEVKAYFQNADFLTDLTLALEKTLRGLYYLGPLRDYPKRTYVWSGERPEHVGLWGDRTIEALLAAQDRQLSRGAHKRSESFERVIARWLKEMKLIENFETKPIGARRKEYEVLVRTTGSRYTVNLTDVGFGISQALPVIVECFCVPPGSTVILEHPELHLHPSAQAELADLFIEAIRSREEGYDRNIQLLVESHSEHFLRRLQRRIAEGVLKPEEAALFFCTPSAEGSHISRLAVDDYGNITNWPNNFFGDEMADLAAMTDAVLSRKATETK
jgi:predicted ATPase